MPRFSPTIRLEDRLALRVNEASIVAGISRSTIYKLMASKKLRTTMVGGRRLILREDLEMLLNKGAKSDPPARKQAAQLASPNAA